MNNSDDLGDTKVPALDLSHMKRNQEYKDWYGLTKKLEAGLADLWAQNDKMKADMDL